MTILYVDADACPVKNEVYRVADRYALPVIVVSNSWIRVPRGPQIRLVVVEAGPDAADDWIAARAGTGDVVITADTPLADRALKAGAQALHRAGQLFTSANIGSAHASAASASICAGWARPPAGPSRSRLPIAPAFSKLSMRPSCAPGAVSRLDYEPAAGATGTH